MQLEDSEERLVYDPALKRYVPQSQLGTSPATTSTSAPPTTTSFPAANSCPPQLVCSPPVTTAAQPAVNTTARRPRYIDPFTEQVHQTSAPIVDVGVGSNLPPNA